MKFNGTEKQNKWAADILNAAHLTEQQVDNLLRFAGPKMYAQNIMDVTIIIENRDNLSEYADRLGRFYLLSNEGKHTVAENAVDMLRKHITASV